MKRTILLLFILSFSFLKVHSQVWTLVWSDEFNGPDIDATNWKFETGGGGWGNNELENYTSRPVNASVTNGNLNIVAIKESYNGSNYTSARMKTQDLQSWTYGKIEARIKLPMGKGLWPAFWTLGQNISSIGWPKCGETDIMEHVNTETTVEGTIHWDNNGHAQYGGNTTCDVTQFHVYGITWDTAAIKWYLDGTKYWEANIANNINSTDEFHLPFFILLNMAVGGTWPGNPDNSTTFPDTMFVDYVRVYQDLTTSISQRKYLNASVSVFPNPSTDQINLNIQNAQAGVYEIEIVDLLGNIALQRNEKLINGKNTFPLSIKNLRQGLYILALKNSEKYVFIRFAKSATSP